MTMALIALWALAFGLFALECWIGMDWVDETRAGNALRIATSIAAAAATAMTVRMMR